MKNKKVAIIGGGIAAHCMAFELTKLTHIEPTLIAADEYFSNCTHSSTAMNCLRGTQKGLSPLGDLVVDSYHCFLDFMNNYQPEGVYLGKEVQFWRGESAFDRRYPGASLVREDRQFSGLVNMEKFQSNDSYFIDAQKLIHWFGLQFKDQVKKINGVVVQVNGSSLRLNTNQEIKFDHIIFCTNGKSLNLLRGIDKDFDYYIDHCKPVAGSYYELAGELTQFESSLCLALEKYHFIYRKEEKRIQIGSTHSNQTQFELAAKQQLSHVYTQIVNGLNFEIPPQEKFMAHTGIRFKGHKRLPFWAKLDERLSVMTGLYKNGFSFSFLGASQLSSNLFDNH